MTTKQENIGVNRPPCKLATFAQSGCNAGSRCLPRYEGHLRSGNMSTMEGVLVKQVPGQTWQGFLARATAHLDVQFCDLIQVRSKGRIVEGVEPVPGRDAVVVVSHDPAQPLHVRLHQLPNDIRLLGAAHPKLLLRREGIKHEGEARIKRDGETGSGLKVVCQQVFRMSRRVCRQLVPEGGRFH